MKVDGVQVKTISEFLDYAISRCGQVWSKPRISSCGRKLKGRWLKPYKDSYGYFQVSLCKNGKRICRLISRLVLETFVGLRSIRMQCRHLDGNNQNDKLRNLAWGTSQENHADRILHGTNGIKLKEEQVRGICHICQQQDYTRKEIAKMFGITQSHVSLIANKKTWKHLWNC